MASPGTNGDLRIGLSFLALRLLYFQVRMVSVELEVPGYGRNTILILLSTENFLYSYIVPILQVILEQRLHVDESKTQATTSLVLTVHALVCLVSGPLTGYLADKCSNRQLPLLASLGAELVGTIIIMVAPSGISHVLPYH